MSETHAEYMRNCRVADREQAQQDYQDRYHTESVEPFSRIPKCILKKRREDELRKSDAEATPKEAGKVLQVRKPAGTGGWLLFGFGLLLKLISSLLIHGYHHAARGPLLYSH